MSDWIGVEDGTPEDFQDIDVWCNDGYRLTDCEFKHGFFHEVILDHDGDYSHSEMIPNVTHWMPLPEPPKE